MRFAGMDTKGVTTPARVNNLSATGLSFFVDPFDAPPVGTMLKMEFQLPGSQQVAWFGTVVRVEERSEWDIGHDEASPEEVLVAIQFKRLPESLTRAIQRSLKNRVTHEDDQVLNISLTNRQELYALYFLSFALFFCFLLMALPPGLWLKPFRFGF
jgi:hypothetical protein